MKNRLIQHSVIVVIIYVIVYAICTFAFWEFRNPIQWIIDIPTYKPEGRTLLLIGWLFLNVIIYAATIDIKQ